MIIRKTNSKHTDLQEKFRIIADYHTHTVYSKVGPYLHGKGKVIENVAAAAMKGLKEVAITDHGPSDFYGLNLKRIPEVREDIAEAMKAFPKVKVLFGIEADITDSENGLDLPKSEHDKFDFINAGYHYVPNCHMIQNWLSFKLPFYPAAGKEKLRKQNTARIVKALKSNNIRVLTHPGDKAYIDEHAVAKACEETDTLVEINTRHRHPNLEDLRIYAQYDVKFVIDSDAHSPAKVGRYVDSLALAIEAGIDVDRIVNIEEAKR